MGWGWGWVPTRPQPRKRRIHPRGTSSLPRLPSSAFPRDRVSDDPSVSVSLSHPAFAESLVHGRHRGIRNATLARERSSRDPCPSSDAPVPNARGGWDRSGNDRVRSRTRCSHRERQPWTKDDRLPRDREGKRTRRASTPFSTVRRESVASEDVSTILRSRWCMSSMDRGLLHRNGWKRRGRIPIDPLLLDRLRRIRIRRT